MAQTSEDSLDFDTSNNAVIKRKNIMIIGLLILCAVLFYMAINQAAVDKQACMDMINYNRNVTSAAYGFNYTFGK